MRQFQKFLTYRFRISDRNFKIFFWGLFGTTLLTYINAVFVFLPASILGFNWSGIAWITALLVCIILLPKAKPSSFPLGFWLPWIAYMLFYIFVDFSIAGLQLTLQYLLPLLMGYLAATYRYSINSLLWVLQGLSKTTALVFALAMFYKLVFGYSSHMAATPMFLLVLASISLGFYFFTQKNKYLIVFGLLFLMPFLNVTRMALLVFGITFIAHFANKRLSSKIGGAFLGALLLLGVVSSKGFQEKTFYGGSGELSDLSVNYYESDKFNSNGRKSWKDALAPGLEAAPLFGNGPRADAPLLGKVMGKEIGEAHNDYMSIRFNYGYVGLGLLLLGFGTSFLKMYRMSQTNKNKVFQLLVLTNMTLFIGFLLFMYSDNILKYTIWFPNYFFVLMGICFSIYKKGFELDGRI
jgi:hypothetical protein